KNAFKITWSIGPDGFFRIILAVVIPSIDQLEKISRRKLFVVTDNYNLFGARDNAKRILRRNLTSLVHDKEIETDPSRCKELSHRQGAQKEDRLQALGRRPRIGNELANRAVTPFLFNLRSNDSHFPSVPAGTLVDITRQHLMPSRSYPLLI